MVVKDWLADVSKAEFKLHMATMVLYAQGMLYIRIELIMYPNSQLRAPRGPANSRTPTPT
jgi:hypothetical protein